MYFQAWVLMINISLYWHTDWQPSNMHKSKPALQHKHRCMSSKGKQKHSLWSRGSGHMLVGSVTFSLADKIWEYPSLCKVPLLFQTFATYWGVFKDAMFKPLTVWFIKAAVCKLSKCHRGGSSALLMLLSRGTVMTGLKVFRQPHPCSGVALMPFLARFERSLWGYEQKSLFQPLHLHIYSNLYMM